MKKVFHWRVQKTVIDNVEQFLNVEEAKINIFCECGATLRRYSKIHIRFMLGVIVDCFFCRLDSFAKGQAC